VAFQHEQEVRILRWRQDDFGRAREDANFNAGGSVELPGRDLETVADEIIINPSSLFAQKSIVTLSRQL
jgi:hypothetical protein